MLNSSFRPSYSYDIVSSMNGSSSFLTNVYLWVMINRRQSSVIPPLARLSVNAELHLTVVFVPPKDDRVVPPNRTIIVRLIRKTQNVTYLIIRYYALLIFIGIIQNV